MVCWCRMSGKRIGAAVKASCCTKSAGRRYKEDAPCWWICDSRIVVRCGEKRDQRPGAGSELHACLEWPVAIHSLDKEAWQCAKVPMLFSMRISLAKRPPQQAFPSSIPPPKSQCHQKPKLVISSATSNEEEYFRRTFQRVKSLVFL